MVDSDGAAGGRLLHRDEWLRRGFHPRQLSSARFLRVFPGYRMLADSPATFSEACRLLQREIVPGAVISHESAGALLRIVLPPCSSAACGAGGPFPTLHVVRPRSRARSATGYRVHAGRSSCTVEVEGVVVSHPYAVLCQLAPELRPWDLTIAVESIVRPGFVVPDLTVEGAVAHAWECASGDVGRSVSAAARRARRDAASPEETILRLLLVAAGFPEARRNLVVEGTVGAPSHSITWAWPSARVGLDLAALGRDPLSPSAAGRRAVDLAQAGWWELRPVPADLEDPLLLLLQLRFLLGRGNEGAPAVARIRTAISALRRRTAHLGVSTARE